MARKTSSLSVTDLYCGAGGSSLGMHNAGDGVEIQLALNHWKLAIESHNANFPNADHDQVDVRNTNPRRYRSTTMLWASPECFVAGTLILTARGLVPVEDVRVGDMVLTHRNRWRPVTSTMNRRADTVIVSGQGHSVGIETTAAHPFYVRLQRREWDNAKRDYNRRVYDDPTWREAGELDSAANGQRLCWATPITIPALEVPPVGVREMPLDDPEFWWLIGRWLGDGIVRLRKEHGHEVMICCGYAKADELERRLSHLEPDGKRAGTDELNWHRRNGRTAAIFCTGHSELAGWLVKHFGRYSYGKTIPAWALGMPEEARRALLDGYVSTDGHVSDRATYITTVSKSLAIGARLLAESLGYRSSLCRYAQRHDVIEGRKVNVRDAWVIRWENNRSTRAAFDDGQLAWPLVKRVTPGREAVAVYNLSVDEDESYVADGVVVHNCTNHAVAKGKKRKGQAQPDLFGKSVADPAEERSRATMDDVPRFAEYHRYDVVIVENVIEIRFWIGYDEWHRKMQRLGYDHREVYFNSMFAHLDPAAVRHPHDYAPQSRDRIYIVFWKKGNKAPDLEFRPKGWCGKCARDVEAVQAWKNGSRSSNGRKWGRYRQQYVYRCPACAAEVVPYHFAAWNAIDWALPAQRIGDREKPLKPRTIERIRKGLAKYGDTWLVMDTAYANGDRTRPMLAAMPTQTGRQTLGMVAPQLVSVNYYDDRTIPVTEGPMGTQTTANKYGLLMPQIVTLRNHGETGAVTDGPLPTFAAAGNHVGLLIPFYLGYANGEAPAHGVDEALPTLPGGQTPAVVMPFLTSYYGTGGDGRAASEAMGTVTAADRHGLVLPMPLMVMNYSPGYTRPATEPTGSITASDHHALLMPAALPAVEDCGFRMLQPHEVGRGMAFPDDYRVLGNKRDRVRQFGNAVTPPVAKMLMRRILPTLS